MKAPKEAKKVPVRRIKTMIQTNNTSSNPSRSRPAVTDWRTGPETVSILLDLYKSNLSVRL